MTANPLTKLCRVEVEFPTDAFAHSRWEPQRLVEELRTLWFLEQVRQRRLSFAKAAELGDWPLARFLELMHEHNITPLDFDDEDIEGDMADETKALGRVLCNE